jgi:hypothetical protein
MDKSWDGDGKAETRNLLIQSIMKPVNHAVLFPGKDLLDLKLGLSKKVFTKDTSFEFIEQNNETADVIERYAKNHKLHYKMHRCKATKVQLGTWDFAFFDFCGQPTQDVCEWLWQNAFPSAEENALAAFTFYTNTRNTDFLQRLCQPQNLAFYASQTRKPLKNASINLRCVQNAYGDTVADPDDKCVQTILAAILPRGSQVKVSRGYCDESPMYFALTQLAKSEFATSSMFLHHELFNKKSKPLPSSDRQKSAMRSWVTIRANKAIEALGNNASYQDVVNWVVKTYPNFANNHGITPEIVARSKKRNQAYAT